MERPPLAASILACLLIVSTTTTARAEEVRGDQPDALPLTPQEQLKRFKVPPGFEVQLVASEPQIQKPMNLNFDAAGRLWATGSELYPWPAATDADGKPVPGFEKVYQEMANAFGSANNAPAAPARGNDTVKILSGFGPDGRAGKIETFVEGLNIPVGVQPLPRAPGAKGDSAIAYSIPNIWRFDDTDGDGKADKREVLYSGFGFLDTHGMSSNYIHWMDGWIYGCHGFRNHSEVRDKNGKVTVFDSGNTYRFKPDGSQIEYWSHGQTNPFGLAFDPMGNLYSADSHSKPIYLLLRGAYYEGIGKQHEGLGFAPRITDDDHGSSAIAGISYYAADQYPEEFRGNLFNGNPVTRRVNRAKLEWKGSTPRATRVDDFLSCDDPWFRPVQVKLGPDGALYIADFYNPIIGHYEVPLSDPKRDRQHGRIWRVVYKGNAKPLPDLTKMDDAQLVEQMGNANLEVRRLAVNELAEGRQRDGVKGAVEAAAAKNELAEASLVWAKARIGAALPAEAQSEIAKVHRIAAAGSEAALQALQGGTAPLQMAAVTSLTGEPKSAAIEPLLKAWAAANKEDVELVHAIRVALRNTLEDAGAQAAALQLASESQEWKDRLHEVALAVPSQGMAEFLLEGLKEKKVIEWRVGDAFGHIVRHLPAERLGEIQSVLSSYKGVDLRQRVLICGGINESARRRDTRLPEPLMAWIRETMVEGLSSADKETQKAAIGVANNFDFPEKVPPLEKIVMDRGRSDDTRMNALEAVSNAGAGKPVLAAALKEASSLPLQKRAAEFLGRDLNNDAVNALAAALAAAPWELALAVADNLARKDEGTEKLIALMESGKASPALLRNQSVAGRLANRAPALRERAQKLTADLPPEDSRLDQVVAARVREFRKAQHDAAKGQQIFQQQCTACHKVKDLGGNIGPNLDGVAARGVHRLVEDILDPNRNVDPAFRQNIVETTDGRTLAGVNLREEGELLVMNDAEGKTISLQKSQVKGKTASKLSLMPAVFEQTISAEDLNHLIAFLTAESR